MQNYEELFYIYKLLFTKKVDKLIDWFREAIDEMIEEGEYNEV